uniref:Uncharacterized protein n=1 Tax=Meloidogyne floridensis TaxID=298350 RepID=A0A915NVM0_9BILA
NMINFNVFAIIILLLRKNFLFEFEINFDNVHNYYFQFDEILCVDGNFNQQNKLIFPENSYSQEIHFISNLHIGMPCSGYLLNFWNKPSENADWERQEVEFSCPVPRNNLTTLNTYSIRLTQRSAYSWKAICEQKNNLINVPFHKIVNYFENEAKNSNKNILPNSDFLREKLIKIIIGDSEGNLEKSLNEKQINIINIINEIFGNYMNNVQNTMSLLIQNSNERFLYGLMEIIESNYGINKGIIGEQSSKHKGKNIEEIQNKKKGKQLAIDYNENRDLQIREKDISLNGDNLEEILNEIFALLKNYLSNEEIIPKVNSKQKRNLPPKSPSSIHIYQGQTNAHLNKRNYEGNNSSFNIIQQNIHLEKIPQENPKMKETNKDNEGNTSSNSKLDLELSFKPSNDE